jgi:DNA mismatch repair protein MutL
VDLLNQCGFEVDTDSILSNSISINAVPETDRKIEWNVFFEKVFEKIKTDESLLAVMESLKVRLASSLACHGSVRRGQRLSIDQIKALLADMDQIKWGGLCPHGRPVWFLISHQKIEETFHR